MATKYSDLELAINTLVTEFHKAADDGPTMNTTQFQTMISKKLPGSAKTVENQEALAQILDQMEVQNGENISFENFWTLMDHQAVGLFDFVRKEENAKCSCLLQ